MGKLHLNRTHLPTLGNWKQVDDRALGILQDSGFDLIPQLNTGYQIRWDLVDHIIDKYNSEESCFIFGDKKITPTLEDVARITGFPIDGKAVIGWDLSKEQSHEKSEKLLSSKEFVNDNTSEICFKKLMELRKTPEDDAELERYVRAYAMFVIACFLLPGRSQDGVPSMYLPLLENVHDIKNYAWGAALLCQVHTEIARQKKQLKSTYCFCIPFLLVFFYEHFPGLPKVCYGVDIADEDSENAEKLSKFPLMVGWTNILQHQTKDSYNRPCFDDALRDVNIIWQPYKRLADNFLPEYLQSQMRIRSALTVLLCFERSAWHKPFICPLKFGQEENGSQPCELPFELVPYKKRAAIKVDWSKRNKEYVDFWNARYSNILYPEETGAAVLDTDANAEVGNENLNVNESEVPDISGGDEDSEDMDADVENFENEGDKDCQDMDADANSRFELENSDERNDQLIAPSEDGDMLNVDSGSKRKRLSRTPKTPQIFLSSLPIIRMHRRRMAEKGKITKKRQ